MQSLFDAFSLSELMRYVEVGLTVGVINLLVFVAYALIFRIGRYL